MEIGFIPNKTAELKKQLAGFSCDCYTGTLKLDPSFPLKGTWMRGEFSLQRLSSPAVRVKSGEMFVLVKEGAELKP